VRNFATRSAVSAASVANYVTARFGAKSAVNLQIDHAVPRSRALVQRERDNR
jgi:hypothetical protein